MPTDVVPSALPSLAPSMSLWSLFWEAHIVVKLVMLGLLFASIWCWSIILNKVLLYKRIARSMDRFEDVFWSGQSLDELYRDLSQTQPAAMGAVFLSAMTEWKRSIEGAGRAFGSLAARVEKVMDVTIQRETERLNSGLMVLSNVASAAPFIGLFGTVFGIMNSFMAIAASKNTSLAVVAPGISESLFATAIGLVAAIPAVIAYNSFQSRVATLQTRLEGFADEFSAILSRQVDQRLAA
jgi:biopolymer transport protein TolQ